MEILQRRKFCREFLNGYNEKLHPQIISKVFEIGLLILKKNFNKILFSKEELDDIIKALNGNKYPDILPLPPLKKTEKLPIPPQNIHPPQPIPPYYLMNREKNNSDYLKTNLLNREMYENTLNNPYFTNQNNLIYPNWWWWNIKDKEEIENQNNLFNKIYNEENENDNCYNSEDNNNNEMNEENNNEEDYINIKIRNENDPNYQELENNNNEITNKNYTMKKLTMNSSKAKTINRYENPDDEIYYQKINNIPYNVKNTKSLKNFEKVQNQKKMQRVKSSKQPSKKINSFTGYRKIEPSNIKICKKLRKIQEGNLNDKLSKMPKYKYTYANGKILRIPEANNKKINLTMTEPNKY